MSVVGGYPFCGTPVTTVLRSGFGQRGHDRPVEVRGARAQALSALVKQFRTCGGRPRAIDVAAVLQRIALDKAHDIDDLLGRAVRHHRHRRVAGKACRLALLRLRLAEAQTPASPGLVLRRVGSVQPSKVPSAQRRRHLRDPDAGRPWGFFFTAAACFVAECRFLRRLCAGDLPSVARRDRAQQRGAQLAKTLQRSRSAPRPELFIDRRTA